MTRSGFLHHVTPTAGLALVLSAIRGRRLTLRTMAVSMMAVFAFGTNAHAADSLVDVAWVKANIGKPGIVFLDVRGAKDYKKGHVPGAVHTNYKKAGWRVDKKPVFGLLPAPAKLEKLVGGLGIDNASHVVLLSAGKKAVDMGISTRLYWTFKVLGHDAVSILDGGMNAYLRDKKNPLESGVNKPVAKTFKASLRKELLATENDVRQALKDGTALIDNRSAGRFLGINTSRPKDKRAGTIRGAVNVPAVWLTKEGGGSFRDAESVKKLYAYAGAPATGKTISFCDTGHWGSLGWFVNYEILGNKQAKMYDGSMSEWSQNRSNPMVQKVKLD